MCHDFVQRRNSDMCTRVFLASPSPNAELLRDQYREVAPESRFIEFADRLASKLAYVAATPAHPRQQCDRAFTPPPALRLYCVSTAKRKVLTGRKATLAVPVLVLARALARAAGARVRRRPTTILVMARQQRSPPTRDWGCGTMATLDWVRVCDASLCAGVHH